MIIHAALCPSAPASLAGSTRIKQVVKLPPYIATSLLRRHSLNFDPISYLSDVGITHGVMQLIPALFVLLCC